MSWPRLQPFAGLAAAAGKLISITVVVLSSFYNNRPTSESNHCFLCLCNGSSTLHDQANIRGQKHGIVYVVRIFICRKSSRLMLEWYFHVENTICMWSRTSQGNQQINDEARLLLLHSNAKPMYVGNGPHWMNNQLYGTSFSLLESFPKLWNGIVPIQTIDSDPLGSLLETLDPPFLKNSR